MNLQGNDCVYFAYCKSCYFFHIDSFIQQIFIKQRMSGTGYKMVNKMDKISAFLRRGEDVHTHAKQIRILGRDTGVI